MKHGNIEKIICRATVCRLGLLDGDTPYIVPLCFGYKDNTLYFHTSVKSRKIDLIDKHPKVCFEMDILAETIPAPTPCKWDMRYQSVIGFGNASMVEDEAEKIWKYLKENVLQLGIDYVLLGGDVDLLPQRLLYPDGAAGSGLAFGSDFYYANLDQPDWDVDGDNRWGEWQQDELALWYDHEVVVSRVPLDPGNLSSWAARAVDWEKNVYPEWTEIVMAHGILDYSTLQPDIKTDTAHYSARLRTDFLGKYDFTIETAHEQDGLSPSTIASDQSLAAFGTGTDSNASLVSLSGHGNPRNMASHVWSDDVVDLNRWNPSHKDKSDATPEVRSNDFSRTASGVAMLQGCSTAPILASDPGFAESSLRSRYLIRTPVADTHMLKASLRWGSPAVSGSSAGSEYGVNWTSPAAGGGQTMHYLFKQNFLDKGMLWGDAFFEAQKQYWENHDASRGYRVFNIFGDPALNFNGARVDEDRETIRLHQGLYHDFSTAWEKDGLGVSDTGYVYVLVIHGDQLSGTVYRAQTVDLATWDIFATFAVNELGVGKILDSDMVFAQENGADEARIVHTYLGCETGLVSLRFRAMNGEALEVKYLDTSGDMIRQVAADYENGGIYAAWTATAAAADEVRFSRSLDYGERWRAPASFPDYHSSDIGADYQGRVYLAAVYSGQPSVVHLNTSSDGGVNWSGWNRLGRDGESLHQNPTIAVATSNNQVAVVYSSRQDWNSYSLEMGQATFPQPQWSYSSLAASPSFNYVQADIRTPENSTSTDEYGLAYAQDSLAAEDSRLIFGREAESAAPHRWSSPRKQNNQVIASSYHQPRIVGLVFGFQSEYGVVYGAGQDDGVYFTKMDPDALLPTASAAPDSSVPPVDSSGIQPLGEIDNGFAGSSQPIPSRPNVWWEVYAAEGGFEATDLLSSGPVLYAALNKAGADTVEGTIISSEDGGESWVEEEVTPGCTSLFAVIDAGTGLLAGGVVRGASGTDAGAVYRRDGQGRWELVHELDGTAISSMHLASDGTVWAGAGQSGTLYRSDDSGVSFQEAADFGDGYSILAIAEWRGTLFVGLRGVAGGMIMVSSDSAQSWQQAQGFESLMAVNDITVHRGVVYGAVRESHQAAVYKADATGLIWSVVPPLDGFDAYNIRTLYSAPDGALLAGIARDWGRPDSAVLRLKNGSWSLAGSYLDMADMVTDVTFHKGRAFAATGSVYGKIFTIEGSRLAPELKPGDVNGDGEVTLADVITALQVAVDKAPTPVSSLGDCNYDGKIGVAEAICAMEKSIFPP